MKKVYVLYGKRDCGKTESLKMLIDILIADGYKVVDYKKYGTDDVWATLIDDDGTKIGITSCGDSQDILETVFENFTDCERIVCAARSDGKTHDAIKSLTSEENIFWLRKAVFYASDGKDATVKCMQRLVNENSAEVLKKILELF